MLARMGGAHCLLSPQALPHSRTESQADLAHPILCPSTRQWHLWRCDAQMLQTYWRGTEGRKEGRKEGRAGKASGIILACDQDDEVKPLKALQNGWLCHWLLGGQDKIYIKPVKRSGENFACPQSQLEICCPTWEWPFFISPSGHLYLYVPVFHLYILPDCCIAPFTSSPLAPFLFYVGARGEPGNEANCCILHSVILTHQETEIPSWNSQNVLGT